MASKQKRGNINQGLDLAIKIKDGRYPINIFDLDGNMLFELYFNPGDPFVLEYADNLQKSEEKLSNAETTEDAINVLKNMSSNMDAIFGDGSARLIYRYDDPSRALSRSIMNKLKEGYADFKERADIEQESAKAQAIIEAKKQADEFNPK